MADQGAPPARATGEDTATATAEAAEDAGVAGGGGPHDDGPHDDEGANGTNGTKGADAAGSGRDADGFDLRGIVKQFTAPMIESLDARLREQVEAHADALMDEKVDAAVSDRMATIERAIADLSRSITALERRLEGLERAGSPDELE